MPTLAVKYRPKTFEDVIEQDVIKAILQKQIENGSVKNCYLFCGRAGTGKAQPLYSKVLTVNGFKTMGEIKIGDKVFTRLGNCTTVSSVYPQGERDIYEIRFSDKTSIRVADNHLNSVYLYNKSKKKREDFVLNTLQLIEMLRRSECELKVDIPKINFESREISFDPYLLGFLVGDESLQHDFSLSNSEMDSEISSIEVNNLLNRYSELKDKMQNEAGKNYCFEDQIIRIISELGLNTKAQEKFIPKDYLLNSEDVRLQILRGLFDSNGYTGPEGQTFFRTSSKELSEDFSFLVRSLGAKDTVAISDSSYKNSEGIEVSCRKCYSHLMEFPNGLVYCSSEKHLKGREQGQDNPTKNIVSIEYVGKEECQCIYVEDSDHTYITDDFIPTHNTTNARLVAQKINESTSNIIELDAASHGSVEDVRRLVEQAKFKPIGTKYRVFIIDECHAISNQGWQAFLKVLEEPIPSSIFVFCTTDPQKIPDTILSRVQRYDFQKISHSGIVGRLKYIIEKENEEGCDYSFDEDAISYIAKLAEGGMRDSITMLEKVLGYSNKISMESVTKSLGTADYEVMFNLTNHVCGMDKKGVIEVIETLYKEGVDLKQFIKNYCGFVLDLCKYDIIKEFEYIQIPSTYKNRMDMFTKEDFTFFTSLLNEVINLNNSIKWDTLPKPLIESTFILLCSEV